MAMVIYTNKCINLALNDLYHILWDSLAFAVSSYVPNRMTACQIYDFNSIVYITF